MRAIAVDGRVERESPAMLSTSIELPTRAVGQGAPTALENDDVAWLDLPWLDTEWLRFEE